MRGFPRIVLSERARRRLGSMCACLNIVCFIASIVLVIIGIYIVIIVKAKLNLVKNYSGQYLPYLIIIVGFVMIVINLFGWKVCSDSKVVSRRKSQQTILFVYVTLASILSIVLEVAGILCFVQLSHLEVSFSKGLLAAMNRYRTNQAIKEEIDWLQLKYKCCGSEAYTDWFSTAWIPSRYLDVKASGIIKKMTSGKFLNDDVPFSCCSRNASRPCIHHHVHDNNLHYNYDYRVQTTLNEQGCKRILIEFYGNRLLRTVGIIIMVVSIIQGIISTAARFLQTSIDQSLILFDPVGPAPGWLITTSYAKSPKITEQEKLLGAAEYDDDDDDGFATDEFDDTNTYEEIYENIPGQFPHDNSGPPAGMVYPKKQEEPIYENIDIIRQNMGQSYRDNNQSAYQIVRETTDSDLPTSYEQSDEDAFSNNQFVRERHFRSPPERSRYRRYKPSNQYYVVSDTDS